MPYMFTSATEVDAQATEVARCEVHNFHPASLSVSLKAQPFQLEIDGLRRFHDAFDPSQHRA